MKVWIANNIVFFSALASSGCDQVIYGQGTVPGVHESINSDR